MDIPDEAHKEKRCLRMDYGRVVFKNGNEKMYYDLEHIKELTGTLITLDETGVISDVFIQMETSTARKLASVLRDNKVTRENQELFFTSVSINKSGLELFTKGQSSMVKDENRYVMTISSRTPVRFKGIMQTLVKGSDGLDYACNIEIGNMDFNIGDRMPEIGDDNAFFENVSAMIYPYGQYRAVVLQDDED